MSCWSSSASSCRVPRRPSREDNGNSSNGWIAEEADVVSSPLVITRHSGRQPLPTFDPPDDGWLKCCLLLCHPPSTFVGPRHHAIIDTFVASHRPLMLRQPLPAAALLLLYWPSIAFATSANGWLLHSPPAKQHTN